MKQQQLLSNLTAEQATPTQRVFGAEEWAQQGPAAVPELVRALEHGNPAVRESAAYALNRIGPDAIDAVPHLVKRLDDDNSSVRLATLGALTEVGGVPVDAIPRVVDALGDKDVEMREAAQFYLRKFGAPSVIIRTAVTDPLPDARRRAVELLERHGHDDTAVAAIRTRLTDEDEEVRDAAFRVLADWHKLSVDEFFEALRDPKPSIVRLAVEGLQWNANAAGPAVPQLTELLRHDYVRFRLAALDILQHLGPAAGAATPALLKLAESKGDLRYDAAIALLEIGADAEVVVPLIKKIALSQPRRHRCREMLRRFQARFPDELPSVVEMLIDRLNSAGDREWFLTLNALGDLGSSASASVPILVDALDDNSSDRRQSAAQALGAIGPAARVAAPKLAERLKREVESSNQSALMYALAKIGPDASAAIPQIKTMLEQSGTDLDEFGGQISGVRASAVFALGHIGSGDPNIIQLVLRATADPSQNVRRCAVSVVMQSGCDAQQALPALLECLDDRSGSVRAAAARALGKFGAAPDEVVPLLVDALSDVHGRRYSNHTVSMAAAEALGWFGPDARSAVPPLLDRLNREPQRVRVFRFEGPYALDHEWVSVRDTVVKALKRIDPDAAGAFSIGTPSETRHSD